MTHHIKTKAHFTMRFLHKLHLVFGVKPAILYCRFKLLIIASSITAPSLAHVFNLSLSSGIVPSDLKLAFVSTLYKEKGDLSEMGNTDLFQ